MVNAREPILAFAGVGKRYGGLDVLRDVSLAVTPGEFAVIYGPPASGKSVLMRLLMGLEPPDDGRIVLRGEDVTNWPAADRNLGYVPQSFALYPHYSVHDNIAYPLHLADVDRAPAEQIVRRAAEMLRITDLLGKRPDQLSGGQKQRVAIARGIAKQTDVFVLDDPLAGLDFKLREQLVEDLRGLQAATGATFVYTTSDVVEALTLADTLSVLDGGRIIESGDPTQLYDRPGRLRTMALVGFPPANFLPGTVERRADGTWCRTGLFEVPVDIADGLEERVTIGIRPEHLRVVIDGGLSVDGAGAIGVPGRIVLREDLGGEEIVYVETDGRTLTSVDRHTLPAGDLDAAMVALRPEHLALFRRDNGERIGGGRAISGADANDG